MKLILRIVFALLIAASIALTIISYCNQEWNTITASISLIIAIISGWIAYEVFLKQAEADKPQIVLRLDFKSRFGLILLIAENLGLKPAFNIKLIWDKELRNHKGEIIKFNQYDTQSDIKVLNAKEQTSVIIDSPHDFFEKNKPENLDFSGTVSFQESLTSRKLTEYPFRFSFKHYGLSPSIENEEPKTMFELQKIPGKLDQMTEVLNKLIKNRRGE